MLIAKAGTIRLDALLRSGEAANHAVAGAGTPAGLGNRPSLPSIMTESRLNMSKTLRVAATGA